jgi:hypothetical protein
LGDPFLLAMPSVNFDPLDELAKDKELFEAASEELVSLRAAVERKGFWTRKNDRAGIREKVARAKGEEGDGPDKFGPLIWVKHVKVCQILRGKTLPMPYHRY